MAESWVLSGPAGDCRRESGTTGDWTLHGVTVRGGETETEAGGIEEDSVEPAG